MSDTYQSPKWMTVGPLDAAAEPDDEMYSATEAVSLAGITYRQLDYWARADILFPSVDARGSGSKRRYTRTDIDILTRLGDLSRLGMKSRLRDTAGALRQADPDIHRAVIVTGDTARPLLYGEDLPATCVLVALP